MTVNIKYTNPRREATIEDWPWGSKERTSARFFVESNKRGERIGRVLVDPRTRRECKPKFGVYHKQAVICDGSDGRTYALGYFDGRGVLVMCGDMKYQKEYIWKDAGNTTPERWAEVVALFA
jgi:hypothetical protein